MNQTHILFRALFVKSYLLMRRYLFNTLMLVVSMYMIFAVIFFGGRAVVPGTVDDALGSIIVGFFLWVMATAAFTSTTDEMTREAQWGTLEQLYMSPFGIGQVLILQTVVNMLIALLLGLTILALMLLTTGKSIQIDVLTIVPIGILTLTGPVGLGFILGALAILYKRIGQFSGVVQFAFIGLIGIPLGVHPLVRYLPMTLGSTLLERAMEDGVRLWELPPGDLLTLVAKSVVFLVVGYVAFQLIQRRARKRGVMGHY